MLVVKDKYIKWKVNTNLNRSMDNLSFYLVAILISSDSYLTIYVISFPVF